eukprot:scaffold54347_cov66-Phaeocystis_antarctica.AAC.4
MCKGLQGAAWGCEGLRGAARGCEGLHGAARGCKGRPHMMLGSSLMKLRMSGSARGRGELSLSYLVSVSNSTHAHTRKAVDETAGKARKVMIETAERRVVVRSFLDTEAALLPREAGGGALRDGERLRGLDLVLDLFAQKVKPLLADAGKNEGQANDDWRHDHEEQLALVAAEVGARERQAKGLDDIEVDHTLERVEEGLRVRGHVDLVDHLDIGGDLVEARHLFDLGAQADRVGHVQGARNGHLEPGEALHEEEDDGARDRGRADVARAHLARGRGVGEVVAAVGHVALLAEGTLSPQAAAEVRHGLARRRAGRAVPSVCQAHVVAVVGAAAYLGAAVGVTVVARQDCGLQGEDRGAVGVAVGARGALCAADDFGGVPVDAVVALAADAHRLARRAWLRLGELGARLARALIALARQLAVRVSGALDVHAGRAPGAGVAIIALVGTQQALAHAHLALEARRRRGAAFRAPVANGADGALGLVGLARVLAGGAQLALLQGSVVGLAFQYRVVRAKRARRLPLAASWCVEARLGQATLDSAGVVGRVGVRASGARQRGSSALGAVIPGLARITSGSIRLLLERSGGAVGARARAHVGCKRARAAWCLLGAARWRIEAWRGQCALAHVLIQIDGLGVGAFPARQRRTRTLWAVVSFHARNAV